MVGLGYFAELCGVESIPEWLSVPGDHPIKEFLYEPGANPECSVL